MPSRLTSLALLICVMTANADSHPDNFFLSFAKDIRLFGVAKRRRTGNGNTLKNKNSRKVRDVKADNIDDDYERAEKRIFRVVETVEKKAIDIAGDLIQDEVDILFGKDHGHAFHDERIVSFKQQPAKFVKATNTMLPSKKKQKMTMEMTPKKETKKTELPHSTFLDFMETYAKQGNIMY